MDFFEYGQFTSVMRNPVPVGLLRRLPSARSGVLVTMPGELVEGCEHLAIVPDRLLADSEELSLTSTWVPLWQIIHRPTGLMIAPSAQFIQWAREFGAALAATEFDWSRADYLPNNDTEHDPRTQAVRRVVAEFADRWDDWLREAEFPCRPAVRSRWYRRVTKQLGAVYAGSPGCVAA